MKNIKKNKTVGVLLMTYGSATSLDDVPAYLTRIYKGKTPPASLIEEFKKRYALIGMSPLITITSRQAQALEVLLNKSAGNKYRFTVKAAMRYSQPFIQTVIKDLAKQVDAIVGVILSPQYSPIIMKGYVDDFFESVRNSGKAIPVSVAGDWHDNPNFIDAVAQSVTVSIESLPKKVHDTVVVLFTAHSMPKRVIEKEPEYISHLNQTAQLIAKKLGLSEGRFLFCYQSAGHTPEKWLKPDFADIMPVLSAKGHTHVVVAPVQFLSDHLETLYDIDIAAKDQASKNGIMFLRAQSLNTHPLLIRAFADVVLKQSIMQQL